MKVLSNKSEADILKSLYKKGYIDKDDILTEQGVHEFVTYIIPAYVSNLNFQTWSNGKLDVHEVQFTRLLDCISYDSVIYSGYSDNNKFMVEIKNKSHSINQLTNLNLWITPKKFNNLKRDFESSDCSKLLYFVFLGKTEYLIFDLTNKKVEDYQQQIINSTNNHYQDKVPETENKILIPLTEAIEKGLHFKDLTTKEQLRQAFHLLASKYNFLKKDINYNKLKSFYI